MSRLFAWQVGSPGRDRARTLEAASAPALACAGLMPWAGLLAFAVGGALRADEPPAPAPRVDPAVLAAGQRLAPKAFRAAARRVLPSVVSIESIGGVTISAGRIEGIRRPGDGPTTGLIISADGHIVTSTFNFLKKPPVITVLTRDGKRHVATMLGRDDARKICLLKIDGVENLPVPEFAPRDQLRVGQWAISLGVGYGDPEPALSTGIISATSRMFGRAVQTDANISPANYGGPLLDIEGRVIGVCAPLSPNSQEAGSGVEWYDSGIGFAVPLHGAESLLAELKAGKLIQEAFLGVQAKPAEGGAGAVVEKVQPKSAAEKAKLLPGDRVAAVDGEPVADPANLVVLIRRRFAGDKVKLAIERGGKRLEIEVTLGAAPPPEAPPMAPPKK